MRTTTIHFQAGMDVLDVPSLELMKVQLS